MADPDRLRDVSDASGGSIFGKMKQGTRPC